ncbi:MAG TPA: DNA polymerase III subunit delta [Xanthobacteraceae bacterium]|jgi:DNA polymerase-3 subunit delta
MVALKSAEIDAFVARPDAKRPIVLVFGPDAGLVRERADALIKSAVDDVADPFALARLDGDVLADDPSRLVEEAHTIPLFGGRRAVWVKGGGRNFVEAVATLLAAPPAADCRVVIEAGDLKRNAPLRTLIEKSPVAAALPCYTDGERDLVRLIDDEMRAAGLKITPDARAQLAALIGGDRAASRSEIRKLALYGRGQPTIELDDVLAVVADASSLALDAAVDAAFAGRAGEAETQFAKARAAGTYPGVIVGAALRQVAALHRARLAVEGGASVGEAVARAIPGLHFRRKALVEAAVSAWTVARLERIMTRLAEASLDTRQRPTLAEAVAQRALMATAEMARRR